MIQFHIDRIIHGSAATAQDRQLAVMLVLGVLRQMEFLDVIIARFSRHPLNKMKPLTLMTLRVGVYQLFFLDRIPVSAAVNETVTVLKTERQPRWIINFANGLLRNIERQRSTLPGPDSAGEDGGPVFNHPDWLVQRWREQYGLERTRKICRANNSEPLMTLRVNTRLTSCDELMDRFRHEGYEIRQGRYAPDALVLGRFSGAVFSLPGFDEGLFHVQDEAAQLAAGLLGPFESGRRALDACAGLGGKTCHLAQIMPDRAMLTAVEPDDRRFRLLEDNLRRLGLKDRVETFHGGLIAFAESGTGLFDAILVDAPCSGTGVIRRHPDIRWNRQLTDLQAYQQKQRELLDAAASLLAADGVLAYATCSIEPEENQQVIELFLSDHSGFVLTDCRDFLPGAAANLVDRQGYFCPSPDNGLDGFFAARLEYISS